MLYLKRHVFSCLVNSHLVLMDAKNDQYHMIEQAELQGLIGVLSGLEPLACRIRPLDSDLSSSSTAEVVKWLLDNDLATDQAELGHPAVLIHQRKRQELERDLCSELDNKICLRYLPVACLALISAVVAKYASPLERTLARLSQKKLNDQKSVPLARAIELTKVFHGLRILIPIKRNCFLDSLALLRFLRFYKINAELVFGIAIDPFNAHCWVEYDGHYLNDRPSNTLEMATIFAA